MKRWMTLASLLVTAMMVAACGANATPTTAPTANISAPTEDAMMASGTATADAMMAGSTATAGAMMMDATATADAMMMHETPTDTMMMDATATAEAMMMHETPTDTMMMTATQTADAMMAHETPTDTMAMHAAMTDSMMMAPDVHAIPLVDAKTGTTFKLSDSAGKVVLLSLISPNCAACTQQENVIKALHGMLMNDDQFVIVSLDIDANDTAAMLKDDATQNGFDWPHAISPAQMTAELSRLLGADAVKPGNAAIAIIDQDDNFHLLPATQQDAKALEEALAIYMK
jgi:cytochrome oxidase Cu insertion factor (SCO1/SenC/PrrC family)